MKVRFWGTRGSLPAAANTLNLREKLIEVLKRAQGRTFAGDRDIDEFVQKELPFSLTGYYGTNTSCVQIEDGGEYVICDAGSGIGEFSRRLAAAAGPGPQGHPGVFHIFISHLHWDHIQGFPFFMPAYAAGNRIVIHGGHSDMEDAFSYQRKHAGIPIPLKADISFHRLESDKEYDIAGFRIRTIKQNHPGDSYGYRFERQGKSVVYSTDCEHFDDSNSEGYRFVEFFRDVGLLIFDAQYEMGVAGLTKENWGHSSNIVAVELGVRAGVKSLCLYHNEPTVDDTALETFLGDTRRYLELYDPDSPMKVDLAYDGMEMEI